MYLEVGEVKERERERELEQQTKFSLSRSELFPKKDFTTFHLSALFMLRTKELKQ